MGRHPMGEGVDPNPRIVVREARRPRRAGHGQDRREPARPLPAHHQGARRRLRRRSARRRPPTAYADGKIQPDLVPVATRYAEQRLGPRHRRRAAAPGHHAGGRSPRSRRRSARTAASPRATPPASTTAPPRACSPPRRPPRELGLPVKMRLVSLRLRRRRARGHGRRPDPGHREGAARRPASPSTTSACSRSTRRSPCRCSRSSTTSASPTTTRGSTRTAARSRSATRWPPPACG